MAITQDTFSQYAGIGYHGQQNTDYPSWIGSYHAEGGAIGFGIAVGFGTGEGQASVGAAEPANLIGVTLRTQAVENNADGESEYAEGRVMSVMEKGRMYVVVADGATRGGQVYVVPGTGEIVSDPDMSGGDEPAPQNLALAGARFVRTAAAGEITEIEIK